MSDARVRVQKLIKPIPSKPHDRGVMQQRNATTHRPLRDLSRAEAEIRADGAYLFALKGDPARIDQAQRAYDAAMSRWRRAAVNRVEVARTGRGQGRREKPPAKTETNPKFNQRDKSTTWTFATVEEANAEVADCELTKTPYQRITPLIVRKWAKF